MEIIDRPLSEIIKEQKIGQDLRRRGNANKKPQQKQQQQHSSNRPRGGDRDRHSTNHSRRTGGGRGGNGNDRRDGGNRRLRSYQRPLRLSHNARGENVNKHVISHRGDSIRSARRGAIDLGDSRRHGVKASGPSRRGRISGANRNERTRGSRRREALTHSRFSRD